MAGQRATVSGGVWLGCNIAHALLRPEPSSCSSPEHWTRSSTRTKPPEGGSRFALVVPTCVRGLREGQPPRSVGAGFGRERVERRRLQDAHPRRGGRDGAGVAPQGGSWRREEPGDRVLQACSASERCPSTPWKRWTTCRRGTAGRHSRARAVHQEIRRSSRSTTPCTTRQVEGAGLLGAVNCTDRTSRGKHVMTSPARNVACDG